MTKIYIMRHGQDQDNAHSILNGHRNTPLTIIGEKQAKDMAQTIKEFGIQINKVYSSPLQRAYTTAQIVTDTLEIAAPEKNEWLIERDFGCMTGKAVQDITALCAPDIIQTDTITYFLSPEGAEEFPQVIQRAHSMLDFIHANHDDANILLVTHGDIGKMLYAAYYSLEWTKVLHMFHFGNSELLLLSEHSDPEDVHVFTTQQYNH